MTGLLFYTLFPILSLLKDVLSFFWKKPLMLLPTFPFLITTEVQQISLILAICMFLKMACLYISPSLFWILLFLYDSDEYVTYSEKLCFFYAVYKTTDCCLPFSLDYGDFIIDTFKVLHSNLLIIPFMDLDFVLIEI
jgi:hypothetical protein